MPLCHLPLNGDWFSSGAPAWIMKHVQPGQVAGLGTPRFCLIHTPGWPGTGSPALVMKVQVEQMSRPEVR